MKYKRDLESWIYIYKGIESKEQIDQYVSDLFMCNVGVIQRENLHSPVKNSLWHASDLQISLDVFAKYCDLW